MPLMEGPGGGLLYTVSTPCCLGTILCGTVLYVLGVLAPAKGRRTCLPAFCWIFFFSCVGRLSIYSRLPVHIRNAVRKELKRALAADRRRSRTVYVRGASAVHQPGAGAHGAVQLSGASCRLTEDEVGASLAWLLPRAKNTVAWTEERVYGCCLTRRRRTILAEVRHNGLQ